MIGIGIGCVICRRWEEDLWWRVGEALELFWGLKLSVYF